MAIPDNMMHVKPAPGMTIINPERGYRPLFEAGEMVPRNGYWINRLEEGGVVLAPEPAEPAPAAPPTAKKAKSAA